MLKNLRRIRVRSGGVTTTCPWEIEFKNDREVSSVKTETGGTWKSFDLEANERVIGIFGRSFTNHFNCIRTLGFVIGKGI
jgi:hypothetical protein